MNDDSNHRVILNYHFGEEDLVAGLELLAEQNEKVPFSKFMDALEWWRYNISFPIPPEAHRRRMLEALSHLRIF